MTVMASTTTAYTTCPLCEATCGLELTVSADRIVRVRGDEKDVFSQGFICPKGAALGELDADPDRLRGPRVRRDGRLEPATWEEAFAAVEAGLTGIIERHGRDAVALYLGNPTVHTLAGGLYAPMLRKALGSRNVYTASTLDQMPKHVACGQMYGHIFAVPVPDIDRTDYLLILGADPYSSNGSLWTAPDLPGRLRALRERGGRFVVVDPRRSRTARMADRHVPIRPGTDVFLLLGIVHELFAASLVALDRLEAFVDGVDALRPAVARFAPEAVAPACGVDAATIRELAHDLAAAPRAVVYGRIGTTTVEHGTLTSWLVDVVNILTGNLDREGGAMFPLPAHTRRGRGSGKGFQTGRWRSRVRGLPEVASELPTATLADEIETPGEGQVRALITFAGNPAVSAPNAERLDRAFGTLEFMVSVDPYVNETTRHADVILPPPPPSQQPHYDLAFYIFSIRNVANFSRPAVPLAPGLRDECEIVLRLASILIGQGAHSDVDAWAEGQLRQRLGEVAAALGRDADELRAAIVGETAAERSLDLTLRTGAYGDQFGAVPGGLSLARLLENPHGIDLGPLQPRLPEILRTPSGRIDLVPSSFLSSLSELGLEPVDDAEFVVIGRRHLRSNNSWLHNVPALVKGRPLCTVVVNRSDAARLGLVDGGLARVTSRVGAVELTVEVTDDIASGVVSIPHGWGHDREGTEMSVARAHAGVNSNRLTDDLRMDVLSGTAVLNGVPVRLEPVGGWVLKVANIAELPFAAAEEYEDRPAVRHRGEVRSFRQLAETVRGLARGLIGAGLQPGDRVCVLGETSPEWTYAAMAVLAAGGVVVPIYPSSSREECEWVVSNSGARLVIVDSPARLAPREWTSLEWTMTFSDLPVSDVDDGALERRLAAIDPASGCVIIYTSGTTGPPKGCVLTHDNWLTLCAISQTLSYLSRDDVIYLFLPLAHVFAQIVQFASVHSGAELAYFGGDVRRVVAELAEVRPTFLPSVPRIFEKVYTAFAGAVDPDWLAAAVRSTLDEGRVPPEAEPLFAKVRATFGGRLRQALSGAAPISPAVLEFFHAAGVPVLEGYGMTESTGIGTVNTIAHHRLGRVGVASPGTQVAIAPDGEILMNGPHVFAGYWRDPAATAAILVDGWLHTGDLGEMDADGFVAVTGRKKDIIITSGGKNIAPGNLENHLRQSRWISHAVMVGDARPYPVVLITLDVEEIVPWAQSQGLPTDLTTLAAHPRVRELVASVVDDVNARHSHAAQVKRFAILSRDLSQVDGELTPTLKVKRRAVLDNHSTVIEDLYQL